MAWPRRALSAPASVAARKAAAACGGPGNGSLAAARSANSFIAMNMFCASEQLQLSQPRPMRTPASCKARIGGISHFIFRLPWRLRNTPVPLAARRSVLLQESQALCAAPLYERAAMLRQGEAGLQRHAARLVDMGIDRDIVAAGKLHRARHEGTGAALQRRGAQRPVHALARGGGPAPG